jgi:hypothetical protein
MNRRILLERTSSWMVDTVCRNANCLSNIAPLKLVRAGFGMVLRLNRRASQEK